MRGDGLFRLEDDGSDAVGGVVVVLVGCTAATGRDTRYLTGRAVLRIAFASGVRLATHACETKRTILAACSVVYTARIEDYLPVVRSIAPPIANLYNEPAGR